MHSNVFEPKLYAAINRDGDVRRQSSSGGVFTPIAEHILGAGGIVIAPVFRQGMKLAHIAADQKEDLDRLRGAKYVQSSMRDAFGIIKQNSGRPTLFCGTPCQAGAIRSYFEEMQNLYVLDVVCHGAPMKKAFRMYIESLEQKYGARVQNIGFRMKTQSWRHYDIEITLEGGRVLTEPAQLNPYMKGFLEGMYMNTPCHACKFKGIKRASDITLGDFWGIEHFDKGLDDDAGTSLVIVNSEKGMELFDGIKDGFLYRETTQEAAVAYNPAIVHSAKPHPQRGEILRALDEQGFDFVTKTYIRPQNPLRYKLGRVKARILGR